MLLSSHSRPFSTLLLSSLRPFVQSRSVSLAAQQKSEELLGKYIAERKKYETPNPFKNVMPMFGKTGLEDDGIRVTPPNPPQRRTQTQQTLSNKEQQKKDIGGKSNKYTQYTPGYTPANLHKHESTIIHEFLPPDAAAAVSRQSSSTRESEEEDEENAEFDPNQLVSIPVGVLEESIEKVANVAIQLKKNEIQGPEAADQLIEHIKLLLQLRASAEMPEGDMEGEGEEGEMAGRETEGEWGEGLETGRGSSNSSSDFNTRASHEEYASAEYWDKRYTKNPTPLDWYQAYNNLRPTIRRRARPHHKILMVGCGNSLLSEEMYKDGLKNIENIDVSKVVLDMMSEKNKDLTGMTYKKSDVTNMTEYGDDIFDIIIDKGTYDALTHGGENDHVGHKMLKEIHRVLKKGGSFILISHGNEEFRRPNFDLPEFGWAIDIQPLRYQETKDVYTYVYTMTKQ